MNTATAVKSLSATPAALKARARRAALKAANVPAPAPQVDAPPAAEDLPAGQPGAFSAMAASLSAAQVASAAATAAATVRKARGKPAAAAAKPAARPADATSYSVGAYTGRAGLMFAFMARCGALGDAFNREAAVTNMTAAPPAAGLSSRAQVLDYFAWAVRHGLLVPAAVKAPRRGGKKA